MSTTKNYSSEENKETTQERKYFWEKYETEKDFPQVSTTKVTNHILQNVGKVGESGRKVLGLLQGSLFPEDIERNISVTMEETTYTPEERSLIIALSYFVNKKIEEQGKEGKDLVQYIEELPYRIEDRKYNNNEPLPSRVPITIDLTELARRRYGIEKGKVDNRDKQRLYRVNPKTMKREGELVELANKVKRYIFKGPNGSEVDITAPLIAIGKDVSLRGENGLVKKRQILVSVEDVFLYDIQNTYALLPSNYSFLRSGVTDTEVFSIIEPLLLTERGVKVRDYRKQVEKLSKEKKLTDEERDSRLEEIRQTTLSVSVTLSYITDRLRSKTYYSHEGKVIRKTRVLDHIQKTSQDLQKIGLITGMTETETPEREKKFVFHINPEWLVLKDPLPEITE